MIVTKETKQSAGSCNFCNRSGYRNVFSVKGSGLLVRFCRRCLDELKHKTKCGQPAQFKRKENDK